MSRARVSQLIVSGAILVLTLLILVGAYYCISGWAGSGATAAAGWRIMPRQEWPQTFMDLLKDAERHHIKVNGLCVYQMSRDEYFWTSEASPELLDLMSTRWRLCDVKDDHKLVRRFQERIPTSLRSSSHLDGIAYYISTNWLAGEKGDLYCAMNDKTNRVIVVRYYYNF